MTKRKAKAKEILESRKEMKKAELGKCSDWPLMVLMMCLVEGLLHCRLLLQNRLDARYPLLLCGVRVVVREARGVHRTVDGRRAVIFVQVRNADSTVLMAACTLFLLR
jgi:hypothetical protein